MTITTTTTMPATAAAPSAAISRLAADGADLWVERIYGGADGPWAVDAALTDPDEELGVAGLFEFDPGAQSDIRLWVGGEIRRFHGGPVAAAAAEAVKANLTAMLLEDEQPGPLAPALPAPDGAGAPETDETGRPVGAAKKLAAGLKTAAGQATPGAFEVLAVACEGLAATTDVVVEAGRPGGRSVRLTGRIGWHRPDRHGDIIVAEATDGFGQNPSVWRLLPGCPLFERAAGEMRTRISEGLFGELAG